MKKVLTTKIETIKFETPIIEKGVVTSELVITGANMAIKLTTTKTPKTVAALHTTVTQTYRDVSRS